MTKKSPGLVAESTARASYKHKQQKENAKMYADDKHELSSGRRADSRTIWIQRV